MHVIKTVQLEVPIETAWEWLSNLEQLVKVNLLHQEAVFEGNQREGVGTVLRIGHGMGKRWTMPRLARITHWQALEGIGWVEIDPARPKTAFPHSQQFRLSKLNANTTLLTDELRGSLNLPVAGKLADSLMARLWIPWVLAKECAYVKKQLENKLPTA